MLCVQLHASVTIEWCVASHARAAQDTTCGDGTKEGLEECDDGNTANNDGCSEQCVEEVCGDAVSTRGCPGHSYAGKMQLMRLALVRAPDC